MKQRLLLYFLCLLTIQVSSQETEHKIKLDALDFLVGKWKVDTDSRLSAQGPWEISGGTATIHKTLNSTLIEEEFTGTRTGKPFLIKTIFGINNANNKFQRVFADSEHGVLVDFEGIKNEQSFVFDKLWTYSNGSTVKLRVVYTIISNDEFLVENMRMPQGTTVWDITGRMKYTRTN